MTTSLSPLAPMTRKCALVVRVSTDRQAKVEEGSLKNQLQALRAHIAYKNQCGERWEETQTIELAAVSGKDSLRSKELLRVQHEVKAGRVNVVLCTSLDRISRSVRDFLAFYDFLAENHAELVCLRQAVDTTTPQGEVMATFLLTMAQFERKQTCQRNRETTYARAQRGLWNGGVILGYDLPPEKKGTLIPNEREVSVVRFAFETYLKCGSILETAKILNEKGFRSKESHSRRGRYHPAGLFGYTRTRWLLTNLAYVGVKEVGKKSRRQDQTWLPEALQYRTLPAAWPAIVDQDTFDQVQQLMARNVRSNHNEAGKVRHVFAFNSLLFCTSCGTAMEGRSGTSAQRKVYFYYRCKNPACRFQAPAGEVEKVVVGRIRELARKKAVVKALVGEVNEKLRADLPELRSRRGVVESDLAAVRNEAERLVQKLGSLEGTEADVFVRERLSELGSRRKGLESALEELNRAEEKVKQKAVDEEAVLEALGRFHSVWARLQPWQRKNLVRLVVSRISLSESELRLHFRGEFGPVEVLEKQNSAPGGIPRRAEPCNWLRR